MQALLKKHARIVVCVYLISAIQRCSTFSTEARTAFGWRGTLCYYANCNVIGSQEGNLVLVEELKKGVI
jgi:hypothetical protein